jgi:hypothetical protein
MPVKEVTILGKACGGLHLGVDQLAMDPVSVETAGDVGRSFFSDCKNVVVTDGGKVKRRKGFNRRVQHNVTSFFSDGINTVFTANNILYRMNAAYVITPIRGSLSSARMSYTSGPAGIYYSNGVQNGIVVAGTGMSAVWSEGTYYGPPTTRQFSGPPVGTHLCWFRGRMFVAEGKNVWYSEYMSTNLFDMEKNLITLDSDCQGIIGVGDALFISSATKVYSFVGGAMEEKKEEPGSVFAAIPGTMMLVHARGKYSGMAVWATEQGLVIGASDGSTLVVSEDRFVWGGVTEGWAVCRNGECFFSLDDNLFFANFNLDYVPVTKIVKDGIEGFGTFGNYTIGFGSGGIWTYEGDADISDTFEDIDAEFILPSTDLGTYNQKRHRAVLVSCKTEGNLLFEVFTGDGSSVVYNIAAFGNMNPAVLKKTLNREQKSGRFSYKLSNQNGGDFLIDTIAVSAVILHNKPSGLGF